MIIVQQITNSKEQRAKSKMSLQNMRSAIDTAICLLESSRPELALETLKNITKNTKKSKKDNGKEKKEGRIPSLYHLHLKLALKEKNIKSNDDTEPRVPHTDRMKQVVQEWKEMSEQQKIEKYAGIRQEMIDQQKNNDETTTTPPTSVQKTPTSPPKAPKKPTKKQAAAAAAAAAEEEKKKAMNEERYDMDEDGNESDE